MYKLPIKEIPELKYQTTGGICPFRNRLFIVVKFELKCLPDIQQSFALFRYVHR